MTNYDDATAPRRTPPQESDRAAQPAPGRRPRQSHVIEGEVVAAEVNDARPADRPSPGRAGQRPTAEAPPAAAPADTELQISLAQIERLAAELKNIAEVITPTASAGAPSAAAGRASAPNPPEDRAPRSGAQEAHAERPGAQQPAAHQPAAQRPGARQPGARQRRTAEGPFAWPGPRADGNAAPTRTGRASVPPPLPPEPRRRGNPDLIFGTVAAPPVGTTSAPPAAAPPASAPAARRATIATAGNPTAVGNASIIATAADDPMVTAAERSPARATNSATGSTHAGAQAAIPPGGPRAEKTVITVTAAMLAVDAAANATGPAGRTSGTDQRRPAGRSKAPRGRYAAIVIGAVALAVPAVALGAVQPWNASTKSEDRLGITTGDGASTPPSTGAEPSAAIADPSPSPSMASAAPRPPEEVTAGAAGEPPKRNVAASPLAPAARRTSAPVGLSLSVHADDVHPQVGEAVRFALTWKDGSGHYAGATQQWGDGSLVGGSITVRKCTGDARPVSGTSTVTHTFRQAGTYTVRLSVTTYTCDGRTETQTVPMTVTVKAAPSPTPSSASPSPSASPQPT